MFFWYFSISLLHLQKNVKRFILLAFKNEALAAKQKHSGNAGNRRPTGRVRLF